MRNRSEYVQHFFSSRLECYVFMLEIRLPLLNKASKSRSVIRRVIMTATYVLLRMLITRSFVVLTRRRGINNTLPYRLFLPVHSTGNDCSSCVFRHSGGCWKIYRVFSCRDLVAELVRPRIYERPFTSLNHAVKCNAAPSGHASSKLQQWGLLLIKGNPWLGQMIAVVPFARNTLPNYTEQS